VKDTGMDPDRLLRLLLGHRGMLLGYILAVVRDFHLAEDVFQEASLVILKKGVRLKDENDFPRWARKVVRLQALNALRKQNRGPELLEPGVLDLLEKEWRQETAPEQSRLALRECLEQLTPKARRLIELRFVTGMPGNALAARLNQPPNTVYVALSRIYRTLSACVKKRLACED
jgi:RNA polymerase sigma-70 factor (ECF subfamily)